jgi:fimbrial chaperone protein
MRFAGMLLLAFIVAAGDARATTITPMNIEMIAVGPRARAQIIVTNTASQPVAIEPTANRIVLNEHGKSSSSEAAEDFLILPTQALIAPGGSQTFRVQWLGAPDLAESRSYLIIMNQLPLQGLTAKAGLQFVISFAVAVNVAPAQGRGALKLVDSGVHTTQGQRKPYIVIENPTPVHALLKDAAVTLAGDGWSTTLAQGSLQNVLGTGLVQPGRKRIFILPVAVPANVRELTASIDYRPSSSPNR